MWVTVLGPEAAIFPDRPPAPVSMPLAVATIRRVSRLDRSARAAIDRDAYLAQRARAETGIGAERASAH